MLHFQPQARRRVPRWAAAGLLALAVLAVIGAASGATAQSPACTNLVTDSGLESGAGWAMQGSGAYNLLSSQMRHGGTQAAYLAGVDNATDRLSTSLALPAGKSIMLRFWWFVESVEEGDGYDGLTVLVANGSGAPLEALMTLGAQSAAGAWQQSSFDLSRYAGQTVQIQFQAQGDGSLPTDFFIDDVEVSACDSPNQGFRIFLPMTQR